MLENWKEILFKAYSMQLAWVLLGLEFAERMLPFIGDMLPTWLAIVLVLAIMGGRLVEQPSLHKDDSDDEVPS